MIRRLMGAALLAALATGLPDPLDAQQEPRLTASHVVAGLYREILNAEFDRVARELDTCGGAPAVACAVLEPTALWWEIQLDPENRRLDRRFESSVEEAIRAAEAWTVRQPDSAEAWFYLGGAYAARVQWRVLRHERLAAARDGKRIKDALERAVALDPGLDDAFFGLGLYQYYADVAPTAAKMLRWLLLLPGGDREKGLELMLRARARGELLRGEADYQLAIIYLWYERAPQSALALLEELREQYPANPLFLRSIADVQDAYFHDPSASLASYLALLAAAEAGRVNARELAMVEARLGAARQLDALHETDRAIAHLEAVIARRPAAPFSALARAHLLLGSAHDRLGSRGRARAEYEAAIAAAPGDDVLEIRARARALRRHDPDPRAGEAYRLSLEGWRAFERRAFADAEAALARAIRLNAADGVARYRLARVIAARGREADALAELERAIEARGSLPGPIRASTFVEAARLHERAGHATRAIQLYEAAIGVQGVEPQTRARASRALRRLRSSASRR
jgi:tetratricopeptide (TPR) repeat protein